MESQSDFICFYGSFLSEELGINNGYSNEINYANVEIVSTLMYQFSQRREFNIVWWASRHPGWGLWYWPVLSYPDVMISFLGARACQYPFDNDQRLHSMVKDSGNVLSDLNTESDFNMRTRYIHLDGIHFVGRSPTKGPCRP